MQEIPSCEPNKFSASQEIPRISWKQKVYYQIHKSPLYVPIPSQFNPYIWVVKTETVIWVLNVSWGYR